MSAYFIGAAAAAAGVVVAVEAPAVVVLLDAELQEETETVEDTNLELAATAAGSLGPNASKT